MVARAHWAVRVTGSVAAAVLAAGVTLSTLTAAAPSAMAATGPSGVTAPEAAIENAANGKLMWSRELNTERPMASITKVMTALVVIRQGNLGRQITIPYAALTYVREWGASNAGLRPGDRLTARQLLEGLILPSGADAGYALAQAYGPGIPAFIKKMNATAKLMGLTRTHFSNFDGLPWPTAYSNYSTAANLLTLGRDAMQSSLFRSIVDQRTYWLPAGSGHHSYFWRSTNPLLGHYPGAIGIKTGWTPAAGHCLLFEATRNGHTLIGVFLDSPGPGSTVSAADAIRILNWAYNRLGVH